MSGDDKTELPRRRTRATIPSGVCVSSYGLSDTDVTLSKEPLVLEADTSRSGDLAGTATHTIQQNYCSTMRSNLGRQSGGRQDLNPAVTGAVFIRGRVSGTDVLP